MTILRRTVVTLAAAVALAMSAGQTFAKGSVIEVSLWDKGAMSMNMLGKGPWMGMMMGNHGAGMPMGPMGISVSARTVKAGEVTFAVTNSSMEMVHEMVVSPIKDEKAELPYDSVAQKVDEDAAGSLGEVADLDPGKRGALTIDLKPGTYILYCNIAGHYALGMWTLVTVK